MIGDLDRNLIPTTDSAELANKRDLIIMSLASLSFGLAVIVRALFSH